MIQLTLSTDAIEGLCAAVSYFIDTATILKEIYVCFLFQRSAGNQAIHLFSAAGGISASQSSASFIIDQPFIDIVSSDASKRTEVTSVLVSIYSSLLTPLRSLLEHNGQYPLILEFATVDEIDYLIFLRYISLPASRRALDSMYILLQTHINLANVWYNPTPLQYLSTLAAVFQWKYPIVAQATKNSGQNSLADLLTIRLLITMCCSLTHGIQTLYPSMHFPMMLVDATDATAFLRLLHKSVDTTKEQHFSLSSSICSIPEAEFGQFQANIRESAADTHDLLVCPHSSYTQQLSGIVWGTRNLSVLTVLNQSKLQVQLGSETFRAIINSISSGSSPAVHVPPDVSELIKKVSALQSAAECHNAIDLSKYFKSSLQYLSACVYLQGEMVITTFLNLSTAYSHISYEVALGSTGQEDLVNQLQNSRNMHVQSLREVELRIMRRFGPQSYALITTSGVINQHLLMFSGQFCPSALPPPHTHPYTMDPHTVYDASYDNMAIPSMSMPQSSLASSGPRQRININPQPIRYAQMQQVTTPKNLLYMNSTTPQSTGYVPMDDAAVRTPPTPKERSPSNSPNEQLNNIPDYICEAISRQRSVELGASGSLAVTNIDASGSGGQASPKTAVPASLSMKLSNVTESQQRSKEPDVEMERLSATEGNGVTGTTADTDTVVSAGDCILSYILEDSYVSDVEIDIEAVLDELV